MRTGEASGAGRVAASTAGMQRQTGMPRAAIVPRVYWEHEELE